MTFQKQAEPIKIFIWSDSPYSHTGFATVVRNIIKYCNGHAPYRFYVLGINHPEVYFLAPENSLPNTSVVPAKTTQDDPYGYHILERAVATVRPDILLVINDIYVMQPVLDILDNIAKHLPNTKRVFHFPVDGDLRPLGDFVFKVLSKFDQIVQYTEYSKTELERLADSLELGGGVSKFIDSPIIYHSTSEEYIPLGFSKAEKFRIRKEIFANADIDEDTKVIISINKNNPRKDIPNLMQAFMHYKRTFNPNSLLYLHTQMTSRFTDLTAVARQLGASLSKDIIFPTNSVVPAKSLNAMLNVSDLFASTTLGEGMGLCALDALSIGLPVLLPDNTTGGLLTDNGRVGFLYQCTDRVTVDVGSGFRPRGHYKDIARCMNQILTKPEEELSALGEEAKQYTKLLFNPEFIGKQWHELFQAVLTTQEKETASLGEVLC